MKPIHVPTLAELAADVAQVWDLPPDVARDLLPQVAALQAALQVRAQGPPASGDSRPRAPYGDELVVGLKAIAERLGMSVSTLSHKWRRLGAAIYRDAADGHLKARRGELDAYIRRRLGR